MWAIDFRLVLLIVAAPVSLQLVFQTSLNGSGRKMVPFWTNTGLCPLTQDHAAFLLSHDEMVNLAMVGSIANRGITHVRIHWLLDLVVTCGNQSDWSRLDKVLDWLFAHRLSVGLELMMTRPYTPSEWEQFLDDLLGHYLDRYGREYVTSWRFELFNEPDLLMYNTHNLSLVQYLAYFEACSSALYRHGLGVGGPAGLFKDRRKHPLCWGLLEHDPKLAFLSYHAKGGGVTSNVVARGVELARVWTSKYPGLRAVPLVNDEADPLTGWHHPAEWRAGTAYAVATVQNVVAHVELLPLYVLSQDNAFLSYYPHYFTQRTLLARIQMNNTHPPHVQMFKKPVYAVMGLLVLLERRLVAVYYSPGNPGMHALTTKSVSGSRVALLMAVGHDQLNNSSVLVTQQLRIRVQLDKTQSTQGYYYVYLVDDVMSSPYTAWLAHGSPVYPSRYVRRRMRKKEGAKVVAHGVVEPGQERITVRRVQQSVPVVVLVRICYLPQPPPGPVTMLRQLKVTRGESVLLWDDTQVVSRCIRAFVVEKQTQDAGASFEVIVHVNPTMLSVHVYGAGRYRISAVDFWHRRGPYSNTIHC